MPIGRSRSSPFRKQIARVKKGLKKAKPAKPPVREVPPLRGKKPIRGKGPAKPPSRERRKPVPFPGSPPSGGSRIQPGRPAKPPRRQKPKRGPLGATTLGVSMIGKPKNGKITNRKGKTINPGKIVQRRGAMSRMKRTR